jgi:hypothetical protein
MNSSIEWENVTDGELILAGRRALPGCYREVNSGKTVLLETEDTLPASLDGRVACYTRIGNTWAQIAAQHGQRN